MNVVFSGGRRGMTRFRNSLAELMRIQIMKTSGIAALKMTDMHTSDLHLSDSLRRMLVVIAMLLATAAQAQLDLSTFKLTLAMSSMATRSTPRNGKRRRCHVRGVVAGCRHWPP